MKQKTMRYCRAVFVPKPNGPKLNIDFGYFTQEQKHETLNKLRESYSDHSFHKYHAIETPVPEEPPNYSI